MALRLSTLVWHDSAIRTPTLSHTLEDSHCHDCYVNLGHLSELNTFGMSHVTDCRIKWRSLSRKPRPAAWVVVRLENRTPLNGDTSRIGAYAPG